MITYTCDRCGKPVKNVVKVAILPSDCHKCEMIPEEFELCPDCAGSVKRFVEGDDHK